MIKKESKESIKEKNQKIKELQNSLKIANKAIKLYTSINPLKLKDLSPFTISANESLHEECTAITQLTDPHVDEHVEKVLVNGLNEYNQDIARERIERYFNRSIYITNQYRRGGISIKNLVLHLGGDFITGWIHPEGKETNKITPIQGILFAEELLIKGIKSLSESGDFDKIVVICSQGNHSRLTEKSRTKNSATTSLEWLLYNSIANYIRSIGCNNVEFLLSEAQYIYYNIYGKLNKFSHGNHFNYQGGIGGIEVPMKKWVLREQSLGDELKCDMSWIGHWHQYMVLNKVRSGGSVIGYNEYARSFGFPPERPQMQYQLLDSKRGYTHNVPIILNDF